LKKYMNICCGATDQPTKALLQDLEARGLLDETLVIWGGEFGRTPMFQGKGGPGRDHHIKGFSMWLAGGGIRAGMSLGATDELGYNAVENVVHVRDLHATMLHLLGIDHRLLSVKYQGLDWRLTGVEPARVLEEVIS
jgi:arylsulfatase A-like enzyme